MSYLYQLQDVIEDGLVATHLTVGMTEILIQEVGEEDHAPHTVEGQMMFLIHTGDARVVPYHLVMAAATTQEHINSSM